MLGKRGRKGRAGGKGRGEKRERSEEDEDRGNGPLPGARVLRLRDITESRIGMGERDGGW